MQNWTEFALNVPVPDSRAVSVALKTPGIPPTPFGTPFTLAQALIVARLPNRL